MYDRKAPSAVNLVIRVKPTALSVSEWAFKAASSTSSPAKKSGNAAKSNGGVVTLEGQRFACDQLLPDSVSQTDVFEQLAHPLLRKALDGQHATLICYGATSSGKTFTALGDLGAQPPTTTHNGTQPTPQQQRGDNLGIIPRLLLASLGKVLISGVQVSYGCAQHFA